jgi:hypothetical protein
MNASIEIHDSEVQLAEGENGTFRLFFSAGYVHESEGRPGLDAGTGYLQPAELVFGEASWSEPVTEGIGRLSGGWVSINGEKLSLVPLPFSASGEISAEFIFASGAAISVSASSVECISRGKARFVENYVG